MKKIFVFFLCVLVFLTSCERRKLYENSDTMYSGNSNSDSIYDKVIKMPFYENKTEDDLTKLCLNNTTQLEYHGCMLVNTPTRFLFTYDLENTSEIVAYNKLTGTFSHPCSDPLCRHEEDCIFTLKQNILFNSNRLFLQDGFTQDWYMSDLYGNNAEKIFNSSSHNLIFLGNKILYYNFIESNIDESQTIKTSLYSYDVSTNKSNLEVEDMKNCIIKVVDGIKYNYDYVDLDLYKCNDKYESTDKVLDDVYVTTNDSKYIYFTYAKEKGIFKYCAQTGQISKITDLNLSYWVVSQNYLYYTIDDKRIAENYKDDKMLYEYYLKYVQNGGSIYRMDLNGENIKLVYEGKTDEKPDLLYDFFIDGEVLYIYYRDYENFKNNYNYVDGKIRFAIVDLLNNSKYTP